MLPVSQAPEPHRSTLFASNGHNFPPGTRTQLLLRTLLLVVLSILLAVASSVMCIGAFFWRTFGTALALGGVTCVFDMVVLYKVYGYLLAKPHYASGRRQSQDALGGDDRDRLLGTDRDTYGSTALPPPTPLTDLASPTPAALPSSPLHHSDPSSTPDPSVPLLEPSTPESSLLVRGSYLRPSPSTRILLSIRVFGRMWCVPVALASGIVLSEVADGRPGGWLFSTPIWTGGIEIALGVAQAVVLWGVWRTLTKVREEDQRALDIA